MFSPPWAEPIRAESTSLSSSTLKEPLMNIRICTRMGLIAGGFVGVLVSLVHSESNCCGTPVFPPTFARLALDGLVVALIAVFLLALYIGVVTGVLLGWLAYHIHNPGLALVVCAYLGAFLGWLVCRILCGGANALKPVGAR